MSILTHHEDRLHSIQISSFYACVNVPVLSEPENSFFPSILSVCLVIPKSSAKAQKKATRYRVMYTLNPEQPTQPSNSLLSQTSQKLKFFPYYPPVSLSSVYILNVV